MSLLASLSLTSLHTLKVVAALAVFSLLVGAFLLPRWAPRRFPRTARHRLGRAALILVPMLLVTSSGALVLNRSLGLVKTSGDLGELIASTIVGEDAQSGGEATIANQPIDPASLDATFTRTDDGMLTTTWTGPISGITLPVFVIAPHDYSPTDGKPTQSLNYSTDTRAKPTAPPRALTSRKLWTTLSTPGSSRQPSSSCLP